MDYVNEFINQILNDNYALFGAGLVALSIIALFGFGKRVGRIKHQTGIFDTAKKGGYYAIVGKPERLDELSDKSDFNGFSLESD